VNACCARGFNGHPEAQSTDWASFIYKILLKLSTRYLH